MSIWDKGPCLCGADDCEKCRPGCNDRQECDDCHGEFYVRNLTDGLCEDCIAAREEDDERDDLAEAHAYFEAHGIPLYGWRALVEGEVFQDGDLLLVPSDEPDTPPQWHPVHSDALSIRGLGYHGRTCFPAIRNGVPGDGRKETP